MKQPVVYIMSNLTHKVLYTGVTAHAEARIYQHRQGLVEGFTKKYHCTKLVYMESCDDMLQAIAREKQIKGWLRQKKILLIEQNNPQWDDLYETINA